MKIATFIHFHFEPAAFCEAKSTNIFLLRRLDTLFIGQVFLQLPETASTNVYAFSLLSKNKPPDGTVISTPRQLDGRGQYGSAWESEPGKNISASVIVYPAFLAASQQFLLSQVAALAVWDVLSEIVPGAVKIKWPNDIYIGRKKTAGILIQNILSGTQMRASVVGFGLNVNQTVFLSQPPNPTSLKIETGETFDPEALLASLCERFEARYLHLKSGKVVPLQKDYLQCLYRFGEEASFQKTNGEVFCGTITGVAQSGRLQIDTGHTQESFDLKEIRFL